MVKAGKLWVRGRERIKVLFPWWMLDCFTLLGFSPEAFRPGTGPSPVPVCNAEEE